MIETFHCAPRIVSGYACGQGWVGVFGYSRGSEWGDVRYSCAPEDPRSTPGEAFFNLTNHRHRSLMLLIPRNIPVNKPIQNFTRYEREQTVDSFRGHGILRFVRQSLVVLRGPHEKTTRFVSSGAPCTPNGQLRLASCPRSRRLPSYHLSGFGNFHIDSAKGVVWWSLNMPNKRLGQGASNRVTPPHSPRSSRLTNHGSAHPLAC